MMPFFLISPSYSVPGISGLSHCSAPMLASPSQAWGLHCQAGGSLAPTNGGSHSTALHLWVPGAHPSRL